MHTIVSTFIKSSFLTHKIESMKFTYFVWPGSILSIYKLILFSNACNHCVSYSWDTRTASKSKLCRWKWPMCREYGKQKEWLRSVEEFGEGVDYVRVRGKGLFAKQSWCLLLIMLNVPLHDVHAWTQQPLKCIHVQDYGYVKGEKERKRGKK